MSNSRVLPFMLLVFSTLALAQQGEQAITGGVRSADGSCAFNFSSGTGKAQTRYCVTANGNVAEFSVSVSPSIEFINSPNPASEGYGMCDSTNPFKLFSYYDYARTGTNNWNAATATLKDPSTLVVTRTTADGLWKLTQVFAQIIATPAAYGGVKITMALTNLSNHNRFVDLQRHVNVDAGGSVFNDFNATATTTTGSAPGNWGFLTSGGFETNLGDFALAFNQTVPDGPDVCALNTNVAQGFFEGDGSSEQRFGLNIAAGQTKTATVTYKPI